MGAADMELARDLFAACERIAALEARVQRLIDDSPYQGPWLTAKAAAAYVGSQSLNAYHVWARRHGIVKRDNGTVARVDLDRALAPKHRRRAASIARASIANLKRSA